MTHQISNYLLEIKNLKKDFNLKQNFFGGVGGTIKAINDISFNIFRGETLSLVGESGSGKTTTGRAILRAVEPTSGDICYHLSETEMIQIEKLNKKELKNIRQRMQMIFQDPLSSLSPRMTVKDIISEPLENYWKTNAGEINDRVCEVAQLCGLKIEHLRRYPHAFSGGQRQRIGIARALALNPEFLVCDEPVSALDVSIQAQILNLLKDLQKKLGLTYLFIAHDLCVVEHISDRVAVMYFGNLVEIASTEELFYNPLHPYTEALMSAIPLADPHVAMRTLNLEGEIPDPLSPPSGCAFHPRCKYSDNICKVEQPNLREVNDDHRAACHFAHKLDLQGVKKQAKREKIITKL